MLKVGDRIWYESPSGPQYNDEGRRGYIVKVESLSINSRNIFVRHTLPRHKDIAFWRPIHYYDYQIKKGTAEIIPRFSNRKPDWRI